MAKSKKQGEPLEKITSGALGRGLSLLNLTVSSGAKFASLKAGDLFSSKEERKKRKEEFLTEQAQLLVQEMGKLKGSLMKAGQMISVYGEHFLPPEVNRILKTLQSDSSPLTWNEMEKVLNRQLGPTLLKKLEIEKEPIAAASMGQVYKARVLETNQLIALKIQYPNVDKAIDSDLRALKSVLTLSKLVPRGPGFEEVFREIRMMLHYESDYLREANMLVTFKELLNDDSRYLIPTPISEFSTKRVLAMTLIEGKPVDGPEVKQLSQLRRNKIGIAALELLFKEIFVWRMVQTDPHFGNYRIHIGSDKDGHDDKIILYDFGAVRKFPLRYIRPFSHLAQSALHEDRFKNQQAGKDLGFLREEDSQKVNQLFSTICFTAADAFRKEYESPSLDGSVEGECPYEWGRTDVIQKLTGLAKDAVFTFRIRTPPREAIFLDRKMVGMYFFLANLGVRFGPRRLLEQYLNRVTNE